jgi:hypothetical protein
MHKLNIVVFGPHSFILTLNELKPYLKFNLSHSDKVLSNLKPNDPNVLICHQEYINDKKNLDMLNGSQCIKILATNTNEKKSNIFDGVINLPTSVKEFNKIVEISASKKQFSINSSIKIKDYSLDKNEKKLIKTNISVILTEKEIQLLELFILNKKPISKDKILSLVWKYSSDADTHTVETHIYRLRKKIYENFTDEQFILNNKEGYYL